MMVYPLLNDLIFLTKGACRLAEMLFPNSGVTAGPARVTSGGNPEQIGDEGGLTPDVASTNVPNLPLPDHRHCFLACQRSSCRPEAAKVKSRADQTLGPSVACSTMLFGYFTCRSFRQTLAARLRIQPLIDLFSRAALTQVNHSRKSRGYLAIVIGLHGRSLNH